MKGYTVVEAKTVDYKDVKQVTLIFQGKITKDIIRSTTIVNPQTSEVQIISVEPIVESPCAGRPSPQNEGGFSEIPEENGEGEDF